jgi:hypothetical protein
MMCIEEPSGGDMVSSGSCSYFAAWPGCWKLVIGGLLVAGQFMAWTTERLATQEEKCEEEQGEE